MIACTYCSGPTEIVEGLSLYPHRSEFIDRHFVKCERCASWTLIGIDGKPIGGLANANLRAKRRRALEAFKPIWMHGMQCGLGEKEARVSAYLWLSEALGEDRITGFDDAQCDRCIELCKEMATTLNGDEA